MSWKHFFFFVGIKSDQASTREGALKTLLDYTLCFRSDSRETSERLLRMSPQHWVELDERLRSSYAAPFRQWPETAPADVLAEDVPESLRQALLFATGAHTNGRIRQRVMWELPRFPGRLTLAISLIRCSDWVPEVRFAAQDAAARLMSLCTVDDVVACWDLIVRLESRARTSQEWLSDSIRAWLEPTPAQPRLQQLLASMDRKVRAWAYKYAFENLPEVSEALLDAAVIDPNPGIALYALRHAQSRQGATRGLALIRKGLTVPHPAVRRESLQALSNCDQGPSRELLRELSCDRAGGVRSLAGHLLRQHFSEDPTEQWRRVLAQAEGSMLYGALVSLADQATATDIPLLRRWLEHPSGYARANALRGLLKAESSFSDQELAQLMDGSTTPIRRVLEDAVQRGELPLSPLLVVQLLAIPGCTEMRRQLLWQLMSKLGHWQHLSLVLLTPKDAIGDDWYRDALDCWLKNADRYAPLGATTRANLLELLEQRRADIAETAHATIHASIKRH